MTKLEAIGPPPSRRKFVHAMDELNYLFQKASYWYIDQDNRRRAKKFVEKVALRLRQIPPNSDSVLRTECRILISRYNGNIDKEIEDTELLFKQVSQLLVMWPECPKYDWSGVRKMLLCLISLYSRSGQSDRAREVLCRYRRLCQEHSLPIADVSGIVHLELVEHGLEIHEEQKYLEALEIFSVAKELAPECPAVIYNIANDLYMLNRSAEARTILEGLIEKEEDQLRQGCPNNAVSPRSFRLDALFLLFSVVLDQTGDWSLAYPYAEQHLSKRCRGVKSTWSRRQIIQRVEEAKLQYN